MEEDKQYIIIQEGIKQLKHYGPGFSLDDICITLRISKKTFYSYFESKSDFLVQLLKEIVRNWQKNINIHLFSQADLKTRILSSLNYLVEELLTYNTGFLYNLRTRFPKESVIIDNYYQEFTNEILKLLIKGQKLNHVKKNYNLKLFLQKEKIFFEHLLFKENIFQDKYDYLKLLNLSLESIMVRN